MTLDVISHQSDWEVRRGVKKKSNSNVCERISLHFIDLK